jgi:hypothetical protein
MSGELLTPEETQELKDQAHSGEHAANRAPVQFVPIPAAIVVKDWGILDAPGGNSWGYTPYGIFATGVKRDHDYEDREPPEHDVLFPYNSVVAVEFDYPAFFLSQGLTVTGEEPEVEDDEPEAKGDGDEDSSD